MSESIPVQRRRVHAGGRGPLDRFQGQAVDHDFICAADIHGISVGTTPRECRSVRGVRAAGALYLLPTFEPERAMPPGKGRITSGTARLIAVTAASAATSVAAGSLPMMMMLPPATPLTVPKISSQRNSPSITGICQSASGRSFGDLPPIAEIAELATDADRLFADRQAAVARSCRAGHHALADAVGDRLLECIAAKAKTSRLTPGLPSGVSPGSSMRSIAASASHEITLVA